MKVFYTLMIGIISIFLIFICSLIIVELDKRDGNKLFIKYKVKEDCNYKLPKEFYLVKDSITGEFAIKRIHQIVYSDTIITISTYYLQLHRFSLIDNKISQWGEVEQAMVFKDSCKAKGFAKMYFKSLPRVKKFIKLK